MGHAASRYIAFVFNQPYGQRPALGGVECHLDNGERIVRLRAERGGLVSISLYWLRDDAKRVLTPSLLLVLAGNTMAVFNNLRKLGGAPNLSAEMEVEVRAAYRISTWIGDDINGDSGAPLEGMTLFPSITLGDNDGFDGVLNSIAGDFANAVGMPIGFLPTYRLKL